MSKESLVQKLAQLQDIEEYRELHWEGSFEEYLGLIREDPRIIRTAYQRVYDMVLSHGSEEYIDNKKKIVRYTFFQDEKNGGRDAIYGLDIPLMRLVNVFKSAANEYGRTTGTYMWQVARIHYRLSSEGAQGEEHGKVSPGK